MNGYGQRREELEREAKNRKTFRHFRSALQQRGGELAVIAEVKKASPSAGVIAHSFNPIEIAEDYELDGANAISVLTDVKFFRGDLEHLSGRAIGRFVAAAAQGFHPR